MKNNTISILALIIGIIALSLFFWGNNSSGYKIGVIQMEEIIYEYEGMKDATNTYVDKMNKWEAQVDTMETQLKELLYDMKLDSINSDNEKLISDQQKFILLRQKYYTTKENIDTKAKEEDQEMTLTVVSQLDEYVDKFASENGFDLIITNTQVNNVGYASEVIDITEAVLQYANNKYQGD